MICMTTFMESQPNNQSTIQESGNLTQRNIVLIMDDIVKYNRITELGDLVANSCRIMDLMSKLENGILGYFL
jgi:hypothetical protein